MKTLEEIQYYILSVIKSNYDNKPFLTRLIHDIKAVENAKLQLKSKVLAVNVFDKLCLKT